MDLTYPPEAESFRTDIRAWLEANYPDGAQDLEGEARKQFHEQWVRKLYEGGWICASWPQEYGGKGLTTMQQVVLHEEFARVGAPLRADFFGDAGSDLAGRKTRAELDGEEWVDNGQKVWTTQAQHADYVFLLARTDFDAPKHAGISYLLVPMDQPGIEVRPIEQVDGSSEFNEVFFNGARCPKDNVVGGVNNGWNVAMTTLGFERGTSATTSHRRFQKELDEIIESARKNGRASDPLTRQRLAHAWSKVKIMEVNGLRSLSDVLHGTKQVSPTQASFFFSRSETIWGGAAEIQRNIAGERVLGLPKEPKPA